MSTPQDGIYPLFPLEVVLYPNMQLPLHIFEPRYKKMVTECLQTGREFGVIFSRNGRLSSVGTLAKIENVLDRFPDGRMNILCLGKTKFSLQGLNQDKEYLQGEVMVLKDMPEDDRDLVLLRHRGEELLTELSRITGLQGTPELFDGLTCGTFSYILSELSGLSLPKQQEILEYPAASLRYRKVLEVMEHLVEKHRVLKELREVVGDTADVDQIYN